MKQINFCTFDKFPKYSKEYSIGSKKIFNEKIINTKHSILSENDIGSNLTGAFLGKSPQIYAFNIWPNSHTNNYSDIINSLRERYEAMSDSGEKLWGFLYGGWKKVLGDNLSIQSYALYNKVAEMFDNLNIPKVIICGKETGNIGDNVRIRDCGITLWGKNIKDVISKDNTKEQAINNLKEIYQDVELPEDIDLNVCWDIPNPNELPL